MNKMDILDHPNVRFRFITDNTNEIVGCYVNARYIMDGELYSFCEKLYYFKKKPSDTSAISNGLYRIYIDSRTPRRVTMLPVLVNPEYEPHGSCDLRRKQLRREMVMDTEFIKRILSHENFSKLSKREQYIIFRAAPISLNPLLQRMILG